MSDITPGSIEDLQSTLRWVKRQLYDMLAYAAPEVWPERIGLLIEEIGDSLGEEP